jgi:hypothetical protein
VGPLEDGVTTPLGWLSLAWLARQCFQRGESSASPTLSIVTGGRTAVQSMFRETFWSNGVSVDARAVGLPQSRKTATRMGVAMDNDVIVFVVLVNRNQQHVVVVQVVVKQTRD